jgi:hypothetical protein
MALASLLRSRWVAWVFDLELLLELFVATNLAILAGDIVLAHSVNQFRKPAEYIPLYFSAGAPILLLLVALVRWRWGFRAAWRDLGFLVAWLSVLVGLGGVLYHLGSSFFLERTVQSLTYAAPFAAPLAYTGLGFLLLVNRMVAPRTMEWARWVIFLATGGFFGNFVLCLTDHATNGFFLKTEWVPVISSALATGFLIIPVLMQVTRRYLDLCLGVLGVQALVGLVGFWFHIQMNAYAPGTNLFERTIYGAPPMAPLLFPNLVGLALIGLWELAGHLEDRPDTSFFGRALSYAGAAPPSRTPQDAPTIEI